MMTKNDLRRLLEAEISLRPTAAGDHESLQAWADSVASLRKGVPDWSMTMLELLNELEGESQKRAHHQEAV